MYYIDKTIIIIIIIKQILSHNTTHTISLLRSNENHCLDTRHSSEKIISHVMLMVFFQLLPFHNSNSGSGGYLDIRNGNILHAGLSSDA